jgi:hypothetical protein
MQQELRKNTILNQIEIFLQTLSFYADGVWKITEIDKLSKSPDSITAEYCLSIALRVEMGSPSSIF